MRLTPTYLMAIALLLVGSSAPAQETSRQHRAIAVLVTSHIALQIGDLATTEIGLSRPGVREGNPMLRWAEDQPVAMGVTKAAFTAGITALLWHGHAQHPTRTIWLAIGVNALEVAIVAKNGHTLASHP